MARLINLKLLADFFNKIGQEETSRLSFKCRRYRQLTRAKKALGPRGRASDLDPTRPVAAGRANLVGITLQKGIC